MTGPKRPRLIAGIELGGTKCIASLGDADGRLVDQAVVATSDPETTLAALEAVLDRWRFDALGLAAFGPLNLRPESGAYGSVAATPKPGWNGVRLLARFSARYRAPTAIQTDVVGAALAEGLWGAARGLSDHLYVTIGTGVGVGAIAGGSPVGGVGHGEAGHMRIARAPGDRFRGCCPFHGDCVEGLVSGPALALRTGMSSADIPADHPVWTDVAHDVAMLLHNLIVTLSPARVAIGGGVPTARPELLAKVRLRLADSLANYGMFGSFVAELDDRLGPPGLGDTAGPLGGIAVAVTRFPDHVRQ